MAFVARITYDPTHIPMRAYFHDSVTKLAAYGTGKEDEKIKSAIRSLDKIIHDKRFLTYTFWSEPTEMEYSHFLLPFVSASSSGSFGNTCSQHVTIFGIRGPRLRKFYASNVTNEDTEVHKWNFINGLYTSNRTSIGPGEFIDALNRELEGIKTNLPFLKNPPRLEGVPEWTMLDGQLIKESPTKTIKIGIRES